MAVANDILTIINGDALSSLRQLPDESAQCCVTSPPYWGLRDYGVDKIVWDAAEGCDHQWGDSITVNATNHTDKRRWNHTRNGRDELQPIEKRVAWLRTVVDQGNVCELCGAWRGSLGLEPTPELYVHHIVEIFRELKRVLKSNGTLWINLGDSYSASGKGPTGWNGIGDQETRQGFSICKAKDRSVPRWGGGGNSASGCKPKDLVGIPWMVAFALRADGWYLRSDIIWSKPNPMPQSVTDRPTKSHEYIFLLSKSERYYYNAEAIKEPLTESTVMRYAQSTPMTITGQFQGHPTDKRFQTEGKKINGAYLPTSRNKRSVWTIATQPFSEANFATFPPELIKPCILAGTRSAGKRCDCDEVIETPLGSGGGDDPTMEIGRAGFNRPRKSDEGTRAITRREQRAYAEQIKASPYRAEMATEASTAFEHYIRTDRSGARQLPPMLLNAWRERGWLIEPEPCSCPTGEADTVIDPFAGSGTTGKVAIELGRKAILIEPKAEYVEMIKKRCQTTIGLPLAI